MNIYVINSYFALRAFKILRIHLNAVYGIKYVKTTSLAFVWTVPELVFCLVRIEESYLLLLIFQLDLAKIKNSFKLREDNDLHTIWSI